MNEQIEEHFEIFKMVVDQTLTLFSLRKVALRGGLISLPVEMQQLSNINNATLQTEVIMREGIDKQIEEEIGKFEALITSFKEVRKLSLVNRRYKDV